MYVAIDEMRLRSGWELASRRGVDSESADEVSVAQSNASRYETKRAMRTKEGEGADRDEVRIVGGEVR